MNNKGSTLILLIMAIAVAITLGISLLTVTMANYKIKKANTDIKQSFYMCESGLNKSYVIAYGLIIDAIQDSMEKADEYLNVYPLNQSEAEKIFIDNYKNFIIGQINNRITSSSNPFVQITNGGSLVFISDKLTVVIESKYLSKYDTEKSITVNMIILVPNYDEVIADTINYSSLISLFNWKIAPR